MNSELDELDQLLIWWESFVPTLVTELQHYYDYLNDLDGRARFELLLDSVTDQNVKMHLISRLKAADDVFFHLTEICLEGVPKERIHHPDREWFRYRKPKHVGDDWA